MNKVRCDNTGSYRSQSIPKLSDLIRISDCKRFVSIKVASSNLNKSFYYRKYFMHNFTFYVHQNIFIFTGWNLFYTMDFGRFWKLPNYTIFSNDYDNPMLNI